MAGGIDWLVRTIEEFLSGAVNAGTETRVALTVALIAGVLFAALIFTPYVTDRAVSALHRWLHDRDLIPGKDERGSDLPVRLLIRGIVRGVQASLVFIGVVATLVVWGRLGLATSIGRTVATVAPVGVQVLATAVLGLVAYAALDILETWLSAYAEGSDHLNQHQEGIVFRVLQVSIIIATGLAILSIWVSNLTGLFVGAGFLGIVVGMAARQTLGSIIAGFVLMFSRPMELGDWVEIDDQEGIVTDITIVNTRLRNFDGEMVVIPNDKVGNATVINRSQQGQLRVRVDIGIDYSADIETARAVARDAITELDEVANNPPPQVVPTGFGESSINLQARFWISRPNIAYEVRARTAVVRAVKAAFDDAGIKIPFPQRELSGRAETGGFRMADNEEEPPRPDPSDD